MFSLPTTTASSLSGRMGFDEHQFKAKMTAALAQIKTILHNERLPNLAAEIPHEYKDKYVLVEFLVNSLICSELNCLESMGMTAESLEKMKEWCKTRSVTLRLAAEEKCSFIRKLERDVKSTTKSVIVDPATGSSREHFLVTRVTEYFWKFETKWVLQAFFGTEAGSVAHSTVLSSHTAEIELKTMANSSPRPEVVVPKPIDVNITWLISRIAGSGHPEFHVDRLSNKCHTPRRNVQVEQALEFAKSMYNWCTTVNSYFANSVFSVYPNHNLDLASIEDSTIFVPIMPVFETPTDPAVAPELLPGVYGNSFLGEQCRTLRDKLNTLNAIFPETGIISRAEAKLLVLSLHAASIAKAFFESVDYIEHLLYEQVVAAIGREVTPVDFDNYMVHHNRKLFSERYRPKIFSYAVRRPNHDPEGALSIEALETNGTPRTIRTFVSQAPANAPMNFSLNETTKISFNGQRFLHGFVSSQFAGNSTAQLSLIARARQFSSFILLIGRVVSADEFEPKHGIIIQNRDDLSIPLQLSTIPAPKEFRDAIQSLSPEQQRFCKALRSMQLESTLFGVCVVQIKPQLERVLNLPADSLTKEIQLTQDLLKLFITHQIPSDLLSYKGDRDAAEDEKLTKVKSYVHNMHALTGNMRGAQVSEAQQNQAFRQASPFYDTVVTPATSTFGATPAYTAFGGFTSSTTMFSAPSSVVTNGFGSAAPTTFAAAAPTVMFAPAPFAAATPVASTSGASFFGSTFSTSNSNSNTPVTTPAKRQSKAVQDRARNEAVKIDGMETDQGEARVGIVDYTRIPAEMDRRIDELDKDEALHATIIDTGSTWTKKSYESLLVGPSTSSLHTTGQTAEKNRAFDLLDSLTKSGDLTIEEVELHVIIATTHCFEQALMETVIQENKNPIEKIENSALIVATTIHPLSLNNIIAPNQLDRVTEMHPLLLPAEAM